jgi:hypothetical protein
MRLARVHSDDRVCQLLICERCSSALTALLGIAKPTPVEPACPPPVLGADATVAPA